MTSAKGQVVVRIPVRRGVEVSSLLAGIAGAFAQAIGGSLTAKARASCDPQTPTLSVGPGQGFATSQSCARRVMLTLQICHHVQRGAQHIYGVQVRDNASSRVIQVESSARPSDGGVLQALLVLPKRQAGAAPLVEIRKSGPLTDEDLAVIAAAMRSACRCATTASGAFQASWGRLHG